MDSSLRARAYVNLRQKGNAIVKRYISIRESQDDVPDILVGTEKGVRTAKNLEHSIPGHR
jgi:hypothetical protein